MRYLIKLWKWIFRTGKNQNSITRTKRARVDKEHFGAHYYLGDLLDQLNSVFEDLPKFKKLDPDAFSAYQRIGATVVSSDAQISRDVEPYFFKKMPSFGCFFIGAKNTDEYLGLRFGCFVKEARPVNVQLTNGTIYRCTLTYDFDGKPVADQFYVSLHGGQVKALKTCRPRLVSFGKHDGVVRMEWSHSEFIKHIAEKNDHTLDEAASEVFAVISSGAYMHEMGMTVRVKKRNMAAVFSIDTLRTPYFFANREKVVNENGKTKPIIHLVKTHKRTLADGSEQFVKSHFRGLREFSWNGYDVKVSMAGKHGVGLSSFGVGALDERDCVGKTLSMDETSERLSGVIV